MATMNISLPDALKDWIESQAKSNHFSNVSDFMRDLVRNAKDQVDHDTWLRSEIDKGLNSKILSGSVDSLFEEAKSLASKRLKKAKTS